MSNEQNKKKRRALLRSQTSPTDEQRRRLSAFIRRVYKEDLPLEWEEAPNMRGGFRLEVGQDVYDWSLEGRMRQFEERLSQADLGDKDVVPLVMPTYLPGFGYFADSDNYYFFTAIHYPPLSQ